MPYRTPAPHRWQPAAVRRPIPSELYTLMDISSRTGLPETLRFIDKPPRLSLLEYL